MSRSHARIPTSVICGPESLNDWKRSGNRCFRRRVRQRLHAGWEDPDLIIPIFDEIMNPWNGPRDGWGRFTPFRPVFVVYGEIRLQTPFEHYRWTRMK